METIGENVEWECDPVRITSPLMLNVDVSESRM